MGTKKNQPEIPRIIPEVDFNDDLEPFIARTMVVRPSPIPTSLAIIMILLGALSVGDVFYNQAQRNADQARSNAAVTQVTDRLRAEVAQAAVERNDLTALIDALLHARTAAEQRRILESFNAKRNAQARTRDPDVANSGAASPAPKAP